MTDMSEALRRKPGAAVRGNLLNALTFSKHLKREDLPTDKVFLGICRAANGETLPFSWQTASMWAGAARKQI